MTTFVHSTSSRPVLCFDHREYETIRQLKTHLNDNKGIPIESCFLTCNGVIVGDDEPVQENVVYHTCLRVLGGKGGFGSMLRAIGAQIEKTTNHEACRDLSGRRMRDVNSEKDLKDWLAKKTERDQEKEQKRKERTARRRAMPNHKFDDPLYEKQKELLSENQDDALQKGLRKTTSGASAMIASTSGKRKIETVTSSTTSKKKKATEWLGVDMDMSDLDSDGEDNDTDNSDSTGPSTSGEPQPMITDTQSTSGTLASLCNEKTSESKDSEEDCLKLVQVKKERADSEVQMADIQVKVESDITFKVPNKIQQSQTPSEVCVSLVELKKESTPSEVQMADIEVSPETDITSELPNKSQENQTPAVADAETEAIVEKDKTDEDQNDSSPSEKTFCLDEMSNLEEIQSFGMDVLKEELMSRGLKCGGTLEQRAERLFSVKGLASDKIDPSLFAKSNGKNGKKKK